MAHGDEPPHDSTLAMWVGAQREIFDRWLETALLERPGGVAFATGYRGTGNLSDALSASARATLRAQEHWMSQWAERVAADPRSSKLAVEAAHQMYELTLTYTSKKATLYDSWFTTLRAVESAPFAATWCGVFTAWRGALRPSVTEHRSQQAARAEFDGAPGATIDGEVPPTPRSEPR